MNDNLDKVEFVKGRQMGFTETHIARLEFLHRYGCCKSMIQAFNMGIFYFDDDNRVRSNEGFIHECPWCHAVVPEDTEVLEDTE